MNETESSAVFLQPIINIRGELVGLGPLTKELLELDLRWINDFETQRNLTHIPRPRTIEQQVAYHERVTTSRDDAIFAIYELASLQPIGTTGLHQIEHQHRSADFGIMIGERSARGKGYGTETARLMLDYAFTALGLHNVQLRVLEFNTAGIRAYEKVGFREIGRRSRCQFADGRFWDLIYMECLATEFESPVLSRIFVPDEPRAEAE
jgi:RimJ/RimL family protein N-acetyltransferase